MRRNIVHEGAGQLTYEIRQIVQVARELESLGRTIHWENIGDPIQKGEQISPWIRDIVTDLAKENDTYGYTDSQGDPQTRKFIADRVNNREGARLSSDDIIFFNGLGDAVAKLFSLLKREARVIGPSPAYSTHSSAEAAHSGYEHLSYKLDPHKGWLPDIDDLRNKVQYNDSIAGILLINPDNPTGIVYSREVLQEIVDIAAQWDLFIICDETYANVTFPGTEWTFISEVVGDVPAIAMRSVSKEFPWPGARCGWIEVYNRDKDSVFNDYVNSLINAKRLEVCSTTLPQLAIPKVMGHENYPEHLEKRASMLSSRAQEAWEVMNAIPGIRCLMPQGALYMTVIFDDGILQKDMTLPVNNDKIRDFVEKKVQDVTLDKRFVYYLLGATGICVVPLTGFYSELHGFRFTLLESDDTLRKEIYRTMAESLTTYLASNK